MNVSLKLGGTNSTVVVTDAAPILNTENAVTGRGQYNGGFFVNGNRERRLFF